jgi:post-segregation antitoxin (ccd killing protein)
MQESKKDQKQKLTLGLSRDVIERSKAAGINISSITEQLLKAITYEPSDGNTYDDVARAYAALFTTMSGILRKYRTFVEVSRFYSPDTNSEHIIILDQYNKLQEIGHEYSRSDVTVEEGVRYFHEPSRILGNLLLVLIREAEHNKKRITELKFALRFVKLLSEEDNDKENKKNVDVISSAKTLADVE